MGIKLNACLSLGVAGHDTSWHALLMHSQKAAHMEANQQLTEDVATLTRAWAAIRPSAQHSQSGMTLLAACAKAAVCPRAAAPKSAAKRRPAARRAATVAGGPPKKRGGVLSIPGGVGGIRCTGPGGPGATSGGALLRWLLRPKRGGLAPYASSLQLECFGRIRAGARWARCWVRCASPRLRNRYSSPLRAGFQVMQCSTWGA
jgi:hypothetical protein